MLIKKRPSWLPQHVWLRWMRSRDHAKYFRRQVRRFVRSPALAKAYSRYRRAVGKADWLLVKGSVLEIAKIATSVGDRRAALDMVYALDRVGCHRESAELWLNEVAPRLKKLAKEWQGEDLSNKNIAVNFRETAGEGLGVPFRCASLLPMIAAQARSTTVIVEPRLVKIFERSFPALEFRSAVDETMRKTFDYVVFPQRLMATFAPDRSPRFEFHPLSPDPEKVASLQAKYRGAHRDKRPLIGISWYSSHHGKDLPGLNHWRDFIDKCSATFVSLQYGDVSKAASQFRADRFIVDPSIDQLVDMDGFVAQISALDGVISIMNTLVHVSAAMGVPTVVLRDDWFRRDLPVLGDTLPWYPTLRAAGKDRRDWAPVFDDALAKLNGIRRQGLMRES
jgi:hypothetical protein